MRPGRAFGASRAGRGLLALVLGALVVLPGCGKGKEKTIPPADGARIIHVVQLADSDAASGKCAVASSRASDARYLVSRLPSAVSSSLRNGLLDSVARLQQLIAAQCQRPQTTPTTSQTQTTQSQTTTQTQTTTTQTTPTETNTGTSTGTTTTPTQTTGTSTTGTSTGTGGVPPPTGTGAGQ